MNLSLRSNESRFIYEICVLTQFKVQTTFVRLLLQGGRPPKLRNVSFSRAISFVTLFNVCVSFSRRLDNNMNIYKGVVQRAQLQLARFQVEFYSYNVFNDYVFYFDVHCCDVVCRGMNCLGSMSIFLFRRPF